MYFYYSKATGVCSGKGISFLDNATYGTTVIAPPEGEDNFYTATFDPLTQTWTTAVSEEEDT